MTVFPKFCLSVTVAGRVPTVKQMRPALRMLQPALCVGLALAIFPFLGNSLCLSDGDFPGCVFASGDMQAKNSEIQV